MPTGEVGRGRTDQWGQRRGPNGSPRPRGLRAAVPLLAPLVLAAALAGAAVVTVERAGCESPGHYVATGHGVEYVSGCLGPLDLGPAGPHAPSRTPGDELDARRG